MEPIYFGENEELFGIFHSSKSAVGRDMGVVLCHAIGQEYIRSHRAMLKLANNLSDEGFNVMRFDYSGCGDSFGDLDKIDALSTWNGNIERAVTELKEGCAISKICLVGLRFGGTMAYKYSRTKLVDKLVLWNPINNGEDYIKEISKFHKEWLEGSFAKIKNRVNIFENIGFGFSGMLIEQIKETSIDFKGLNTDTLVIGKDCTALLSSKTTCLEPLNYNFWLKSEDEMDKGMVPVQDINQIVNWLVKD